VQQMAQDTKALPLRRDFCELDTRICRATTSDRTPPYYRPRSTPGRESGLGDSIGSVDSLPVCLKPLEGPGLPKVASSQREDDFQEHCDGRLGLRRRDYNGLP
jgi:hypothetical protein